MIVKLLRLLFTKVIGEIPEEKKRKLLMDFNDLMREVAKAAAEGAVSGAMKK